MTMRSVAFGFALAAVPCWLSAQQTMPDMPGMPGMKMTPAPPPAAPSKPQVVKPPAAVDLGRSLELPFAELQEPEALGFHTGTNLPAPELLGAVTGRAPMPVESFLALADKANPTLAQAQRDVERSEQQARQAGLPPNPVVGYSGDHIRGGEYHGGEEGAFFSQEFVLGRKLALRREVYRAEGRANAFGIEIQRARVHNDVGRAFFAALAAQEAVKVQDRLLEVALDAEANAHELERVGQADASDVLTAEIAAEQAKVEFVTAQRMFLGAYGQLATLAGQGTLEVHPLTGALTEPPQLNAEAKVASDAAQSPSVKQAQANVGVAEARLKSAEREKVPNLNVKAGEWTSGEVLGATKLRAGPESFVEASVQLPLWNRNQGNVAAARVGLERAREDVTRMQLRTRHQAEPLAQQYETARYTAEKYRTEMLPRARRAYELEVLKYQQMAQAYAPVLAAERLLFTLQLGYVQALNRAWEAAIALENYTLGDALEEPMSVGSDGTSMNLPTAPGGGNL